jgi:hypothetical protein
MPKKPAASLLINQIESNFRRRIRN